MSTRKKELPKASLFRMQGHVTRLLGGGFAMLAIFAWLSGARAQSPSSGDPWPDLARTFFQGRSIVNDPDIVSLDAPARAEDAAIVPMTLSVHTAPNDARRVVKLTLIIDENPVPLAAAFRLGENANVSSISTRVRVNSYTNVHLVAELSDGSLHMTTRYVKAAGGCSAPMVKSQDEADATLGHMKFRVLPDGPDGRHEALVMVRHPNNSGMQMDQITRLYTPARYVDHLAVYQGADLVFSMEGGISVSEDPNFRFTYAPNGAKTFRVEAGDSNGAHFSGSWPADRDGA
jgi:sulfur-oxidizing protein SoxY